MGSAPTCLLLWNDFLLLLVIRPAVFYLAYCNSLHVIFTAVYCLSAKLLKCPIIYLRSTSISKQTFLPIQLASHHLNHFLLGHLLCPFSMHLAKSDRHNQQEWLTNELLGIWTEHKRHNVHWIGLGDHSILHCCTRMLYYQNVRASGITILMITNGHFLFFEPLWGHWEISILWKDESLLDHHGDCDSSFHSSLISLLGPLCCCQRTLAWSVMRLFSFDAWMPMLSFVLSADSFSRSFPCAQFVFRALLLTDLLCSGLSCIESLSRALLLVDTRTGLPSLSIVFSNVVLTLS